MIETQGLSRTFRTRSGAVEAVRELDLTVPAGEIVGLLGPNGAGKSTTMRMLTTLLRPTGGSGSVLGRDLRKDPAEIRRRIGYVGQDGSALDESLVGEELVLQARLFGIGRADAHARVADLLRRMELEGLDRRTYGSLSGGQRRRVDIAAGLVHGPTLLFLDEPTTGLDPQSRANLWQHVRGLRAAGTSVVLTTHYLEEADALCDRVMIMDHGTLAVSGTPAELKGRLAGDMVTFTVDGDAGFARDVAAREAAPRETWIDGDQVILAVESGEAVILPVLRALEAAQVPPKSLSIKTPSLDDVFLQVTGRSLRETGHGVGSTDPVVA
ncbi:ABC transporter ATP-binding protein [Spiractinospora alimapuensis]|nr:ABC transporter ATP-binding protein [Spiractinospora alimapuensis]